MWATHRTLIFAAWHTLPIVRRSRFGFSDEVWLYSLGTGVWRSLVARFVRDEEAVGSNPATPTVNRRDRLVPAILYVYSQTDCQHGRKGGNEAGAGGRAPLRHAGGCGARGRRQGTPSACGRLRYSRAAAEHPFDMREAAVPEGGGRAPLRHAGSCGARGRVAGHPFGIRAAAVPEGGGRAWPGFEPTRRAEGSRRGRRAGGPTPSGAESSWGGGPTPLSTEKGHRHCAVTIENGDPTHQQHGRQGPHVRSSHVHNVEACITNLFHVINFQCIHSYDI